MKIVLPVNVEIICGMAKVKLSKVSELGEDPVPCPMFEISDTRW
jgi:hypothetical protein